MIEDHPEIASSFFRIHHNELITLPWGLEPEFWRDNCPHQTELPLGISRHPVFFINCLGNLFAVKEMPSGEALKEFRLLEQLENLRLPAVEPVGTVQLAPAASERSYLISHYLDRSLPYRTLFMSPTKEETRAHLLDSMAGLLVQLHLAGVYWGDCSLSNTLFRRDAGTLAAYLVDAESVEIHSTTLTPTVRFSDLQMMDANIVAEMLELAESGYEYSAQEIYDTGLSIRQRYYLLWEEITRQEKISPDESYRIQERIKIINSLGFSVEDVKLLPSTDGNMLRLKIVVAGRNFHRDQLLELTGLETEEMQARKLVNEIQEIKAKLSRDRNEEVAIESASYHWLQYIYKPVVIRLQSLIDQRQSKVDDIPELDSSNDRNPGRILNHEPSLIDPVELYCQVLEHKWYLSEQARHDVGHMTAVEDFLHYMNFQDSNDSEI